MQTFLPYADFAESARVLDRARLGKQRVECLQILRALAEPDRGWSRHPAALMWRGHEAALVDYGLAVCAEWSARGYKDTCAVKIAGVWPYGPADRPAWFGDPDFHRSHQSNLIRKDPIRYGPLFPGVPSGLPYVWPVCRARKVLDGKGA